MKPNDFVRTGLLTSHTGQTLEGGHSALFRLFPILFAVLKYLKEVIY